MPLYRAQGLLCSTSLSTWKIVFDGLGSLGSLAAANFAYPFRQIVLVDPQKLKPENVERHLLGRRFVGHFKVEGVAEYLIDKGVPPDRIVVSTGRAEQVCEEHPDTDLAIVNIDDPQIEADINGWCIKHNIPAVCGGIYPRGTGSEVIVIPSPRDACYFCACQKMQRNMYQGVEVNYATGETAPTSIPALHWTISATAADLAGFALEMLSGGNVPAQVLVRANQSFEPVLTLHSEQAVAALAPFVDHQPKFGLVPALRIIQAQTGQMAVLEARRSLFSLRLARSPECPMHEPQRTFTPDDINKRRY